MSEFYQGGNRNKGGNRGGGFRGGKGGFKKFGGGGFKKFGGDRERGGFGGDRFEKREVTMHQATCGECGNSCEVPFKPSGDKPVYCDSCFTARRDARDAGHVRPERQQERGTKERYTSTPRELRPEAKAFDNSKNEKAINDMRAQVSDLSQKIDSLIAVVAGMQTKIVVPKAEKVEKTEKVVKVSTKKVAAKKAVSKKKK